ncbi:hypothetical protein Naga_101197g2, partial [Nannochloropsis gaditana]
MSGFNAPPFSSHAIPNPPVTNDGPNPTLRSRPVRRGSTSQRVGSEGLPLSSSQTMPRPGSPSRVMEGAPDAEMRPSYATNSALPPPPRMPMSMATAGRSLPSPSSRPGPPPYLPPPLPPSVSAHSTTTFASSTRSSGGSTPRSAMTGAHEAIPPMSPSYPSHQAPTRSPLPSSPPPPPPPSSSSIDLPVTARALSSRLSPRQYPPLPPVGSFTGGSVLDPGRGGGGGGGGGGRGRGGGRGGGGET